MNAMACDEGERLVNTCAPGAKSDYVCYYRLGLSLSQLHTIQHSIA